MFKIMKYYQVSLAHRVDTQDLKGFDKEVCKISIHGHNMKIGIGLTSENVDPVTGMVMDFTFLKPAMFEKYNLLHPNHLDHKTILQVGKIDGSKKYKLVLSDIYGETVQFSFPPTAELLAKFFAHETGKLVNYLIRDSYILLDPLSKMNMICEIWETENSVASYSVPFHEVKIPWGGKRNG